MMAARERKQKYLARDQYEDQHEDYRMLVPRTRANDWSNSSGYYRKKAMPELVARPSRGRWEEDQVKMERHLQHSRLDKVMFPENKEHQKMFNPVGIPLMDILAVETEKEHGWTYPSRDTMISLQVNRGLSRSMLDTCTVQEIILNGNQSKEEQRDIVRGHYNELRRDQAEMPGSPLSLDVEQVVCTLMDVLDLTGQRDHRSHRVKFHSRPGSEYHNHSPDSNFAFPCRLMWGNGVSWAVMVTILTNPRKINGRVEHTVEKFTIPDYVVDLLENLPIVTGFGIKKNVLSIEDTFSLLAGREIKLNGFVELASLMLLAGWGLRTANMPAVHSLVCGSVLNKVVSQGDERWGVRWDEPAPSLRVYALGDVKHGWIVYTTTIGILLRDLFPDPESALYLSKQLKRNLSGPLTIWLLRRSLVPNSTRTRSTPLVHGRHY